MDEDVRRMRMSRELAPATLFIASLFLLLSCGNTTRSNISFEESIEQLNRSDIRDIRGKYIAKTVEVENGDLFDCVEINNQPAFDNILLRNHIIQKEPTSYPYHSNHEKLSESFFHAGLNDVKCPVGTIPIHRITKESTVGHTYYPKFGVHRQTKDHPQNSVDQNVHYFAVRTTAPGIYFGARASLSIHEIEGIYPDQFSSAALWIADAPSATTGNQDMIVVGWMVNYELYQDYQPRLTAAWGTMTGQGCFNIQCPGFIQTSQTIALGVKFENVSKYMGQQVYATFSVFKDHNTSNWWLTYGDDLKPIGYWPSKLFSNLTSSTGHIEAGGTASSPQGEPSPKMGSGHFPNEGFRAAAFVTRIQTVDANNAFVKTWFNNYGETAPCYRVGKMNDDGGDIELNFYYGGEGGCLG